MSPRQRRWLVIGVALAVLVATLGLAYVRYLGVKPHLSTLLALAHKYQSLDASQLDVAAWDASRILDLRHDLERLEASLRGLRSELALPLSLCAYLGWLPRYGPTIQAAPALLDMGIELVSSGWWALLGAEPLLDLWPPDLADMDALLDAALLELAHARRYFLQAHDHVQAALGARAQLDLAALDPRLAGPLGRLDGYLPTLQMGMRGILVAPQFLGAGGQRNYLLLAQNSHELRPTGGLISGIGLLSTRGGQVESLEIVDSYAFDRFQVVAHPPAPAPLATYMWAGVLALRDANWSPDFPTSAEVVAGLYQLSRPEEPVYGVIAADLRAVELLVDALGPLQLQGYDETLTGANVIALMQQYWAQPVGAGTIEEQKSSDWWSHRKDIMHDLVQAAMARMQDDPLALDLRKLAAAAAEALEGKHVLLYSRDADIQRLLVEFGWAGELRSWSDDYVMVVDANLGFNKLDANIQRQIAYTAYLDRAAPEGELSLTYRNQSPASDEPCRHEDLFGLTEYQVASYEEMMQGCYWNYVRVYLPAGSELLGVDGASWPVDATREKAKAVYGTFFVVPPGETHQLRFRYRLPALVQERLQAGEYRLLTQKQPGVTKVPMRITLQLSPGLSISGETPFLEKEGRWELETALTADRQMALELRRSRDGLFLQL